MKTMYFIMAGILISSIFVITLLIPQLDNNLRDSYFLYSILVVELMGMWIYRYFQLKEKREEKKTGHTERLVEKIFKPMLNITIRKYDDKECLVISKLGSNERMMRFTTGEGMSDDDYYSIDELPYPYYDWAINHMQKYPELKKSFEKLQEFAIKNEKIGSELKNSHIEKIQSELKHLFPNFVENKKYLSDIDSFYVFRNVEKICQIYGQLGGTIDPISVKEYVDNKYVLSSNHNGREYLISNDKSKLDKSKFMELLKNVNSDEKITTLSDKFIKSISESINEEKIFKKNLALVVEKLDTGDVLIKGSCEGCS